MALGQQPRPALFTRELHPTGLVGPALEDPGDGEDDDHDQDHQQDGHCSVPLSTPTPARRVHLALGWPDSSLSQ